MSAIRLVFALIAGGCALNALPVRATEPALPVASASPTPSLGRLFMTPDWRVNLERQRQLNIRESRSLEGESMRLDGVVVRSAGKPTVWVNNHPQGENAQDSGVAAVTSRQQPGRAMLSAGTEPPADLKVGVTLNRATRETGGGLADGEIRVNRPPAPRK
jgi:hypothetical protein